MDFSFLRNPKPTPKYSRPEPTVFPEMKHGFISALYQGVRTGGDFFDVLMVPKTESIVFLLLDIAGQRDEALQIASDAQVVFRKHARENLSSNKHQRSR